jgi:hypothetical protein
MTQPVASCSMEPPVLMHRHVAACMHMNVDATAVRTWGLPAGNHNSDGPLHTISTGSIGLPSDPNMVFTSFVGVPVELLQDGPAFPTVWL